jgi:ABC-type multidrug transport system ATPase subunit
VFTPAEIAEWKAKLKGKDIDFVLSDIMVKKDNNPQDETILNVQGSITIKANTLTGIVGESGAGKTTFVSVLIGTLKPTAGVVSIHVDGSSYRLSDIPLEALHNEIGYSEQDGFQGDGIGVKRYINLGANEHDSSRKLAPEKALEIAQVKFLDHLQLDTTVIGNNNSFSGGEKSRLKVAQVLVGNRKTLIWDEPHTGLDNSNKGEILKLIFEKYRRSKTQIYISHDLSGFDQCDQIIVIERGKAVMSGTAADMKRLSSHYQSLIAIAGEHPVPTIWNKPRAGADDSMDQLTLPGL